MQAEAPLCQHKFSGMFRFGCGQSAETGLVQVRNLVITLKAWL